jgi:uncharacterized protein YaiL (DUF2058 family)
LNQESIVMSESLRDQLLKSGLARTLKPEPRRNPAPAKRPPPSANKSAPPKRERSEIDLAKAYAIRDSAERAERDRAQREAEQRAREKRERKQKLANLLNGKVLNVQSADIPRHFPHANKIRRIYVTQEQLPRLNGGELAVVQMGGRYLLVESTIAKTARDIDAEVLVLLCDPQVAASEDDVPSDLVW